MTSKWYNAHTGIYTCASTFEDIGHFEALPLVTPLQGMLWPAQGNNPQHCKEKTVYSGTQGKFLCSGLLGNLPSLLITCSPIYL